MERLHGIDDRIRKYTQSSHTTRASRADDEVSMSCGVAMFVYDDMVDPDPSSCDRAVPRCPDSVGRYLVKCTPVAPLLRGARSLTDAT